MIEFRAAAIYFDLERLDKEVRKWRDKAADSLIPEEDYARLDKLLCRLLESELVRDEILSNQFIALLTRIQYREYRAESLAMQLDDLRVNISSIISNSKFALIPQEMVGYFEQEALFGAAVREAFPSARYDIKEAGNCFAIGVYTATVFHLMRAVERALRVLAKDLGVSFPGPIEYQEWNTIIEELQRKAKDRCDHHIQGRKAKSEARDFYNGACGEFLAFKDAWRNHVMHARNSYDQLMAQSVMNHAREFMQRLAIRLREGRRTPLTWK